MSTLAYALLGLLAREPATGYQLAQRLRAPIGYFWTASHSQVYPELARLEALGLVRHRVIAGPGPRDTKSYRITATGRRELAAWAVRPVEPAPERDEFLLKVYSLWTADPAGALTMIESRRETHRTALARYEEIEESIRAHTDVAALDPCDPAFGNYATLRAGLSYERHALGWCDWLLEALGAPTARG